MSCTASSLTAISDTKYDVMTKTAFAPLISIIVPVYNCASYVERCLKSILVQGYQRIEVIVIDDGSTDAGADICKVYATQDARVNLIRQNNRGLSAARNAGLDRATGEYITFVDGDDYIDHDMLEKYIMYLATSPDSIVISGYKIVYNDTIISTVRNKYRTLNTEDALKELYKDEYVFHNFMWNKLYKRELFDNIRFPEGNTYEDIFVQYKLFESTSHFIVIPFCGYNYVQRRDSITKTHTLSNTLDCINAHLNRFANATIKTPQLSRYLAQGMFRAYVELKISGLINIRQRKTFRERSRAVDLRMRTLGSELRPQLPGYKYCIMSLGWRGVLVTDIFAGLCGVANKLRRKIIGGRTNNTKLQRGGGGNWLNWLPGHATDGSWILMDRDTRADDNAEHLYRWLRRHHPERKILFALRRDSHDWPRLAADGFALLDIASIDYAIQRIRASMVVSSQADDYIFEPFSIPRKIPFHRVGMRALNWLFSHIKGDCRYVFLQHGVTMNDVAEWLNSKPISLLITATPGEHQAITGNTCGFRFTEEETGLTGFPRHDALVPYIGSSPAHPQVTVMPSWRSWALGKDLHSNTRLLKRDFMDSRYARAWQAFLNSDGLRRLREQYGFDIVFCPHVNMQPYLSRFKLPAHVRPLSLRETRIQEIFAATSLLVTDYSSVSFEHAFLLRPVVYYQFDAEEFFSGRHVVTRGYFNYERDGFGPVAAREHEVLEAINEIAAHNFTPQPPYLERMQQAFPLRDGKNCERVYEAMLDIRA